MKRLALTVSAVCLAAAPAIAADLPSRYAPAPGYYDPIPVFTWTGLYAGLNAEFGIGSFSGGAPFGRPIGGAGGGTLGYNYQQGKLLVGLEGDFDYGYFGGSGSSGALINGSGAAHPIVTVRGRLGYVWDRALIYVTGGYAGTSLTSKINDFSSNPNLLISESHYLNGYAVGFGLEYALTTKISAKAEYMFTGFGSSTAFGGTPDAVSEGMKLSTVRVGLNYHF